MVRLSLAIAFATALFGVSSAATVVSLPFSRATGVPNWKHAITADMNRAFRFSGTSKTAELAIVGSSVTAENYDFSYVINFEVGNQNFTLIVDTGSSNTWVGAGTKYVPKSTARNTGDTVSVSYGSGSFSGEEYIDTVTLGTLVITNQSIGVATSSTGFFGVDGIIGFGPTILTNGTVSSTYLVPTIIDNAYSEGLISTKVLGVYFAPIKGSSTTSDNGELTLGGIDSSKYTGSITYSSITSTYPSRDYWGINISNIAYGTTSVSNCSLPGIVDTGTTLIYLQTSTYNALYQNISGYKVDPTTGLVIIPSSSFSSLEVVTFTIAGTDFTLTPDQYILPQDQVANFGGTPGTYYSLIGDLGTETGLDFILGQKFLENYYSIYDTTNSRVGLAYRA